MCESVQSVYSPPSPLLPSLCSPYSSSLMSIDSLCMAFETMRSSSSPSPSLLKLFYCNDVDHGINN